MGQDRAADSAKPKTQLEAFAAETGAVLIKGFTTVGTLKGSGTISVDARELTNATTRTTRTGIVIEVKQGSARESSSYIDYDEIDSLIAGIDYISKIDRSITRHTTFEALYTTKGDFTVTVFNDENGKLAVAVTSGRIGRASVFFELSKLAELRTLVTRAKATLDKLKEPAGKSP